MPTPPPPGPGPAPSEVTVDDLFDVLARLGYPTLFLHDSLREPGPEDLPQLLGALAAAVDRLAVAHQIPAHLEQMRGWAAGYLQTQGAGNACGDRAAFDLLTVRLQMFEVLVEGYRTPGGPLGDLLRALLGAASCYAVAGAVAQAVQAGIYERGDAEIIGLSRRQLGEGRALITAAAALEARLTAMLAAAEQAGRADA